MSKKFKVKLVTAEKPYFEGECEEIQIPAYDGMMGVKHDHAPFVTKLGTGIAVVKTDEGNAQKFAMQNGFIQIAENDVTVLAERISAPKDIKKDELDAKLNEFSDKIMHAETPEAKQKTELELAWLKSLKSLTK